MFNFLTKFSMKYIIIVNGSIKGQYNSGTEIVKSIAHSDAVSVSIVVFSPSDLHVGFKNSIGNVDIRMEYHCLVAPITLST